MDGHGEIVISIQILRCHLNIKEWLWNVMRRVQLNYLQIFTINIAVPTAKSPLAPITCVLKAH